MGSLLSLRISASGLTAQRLRMDTISGNIANVNTTRSGDGGPYKRRTVALGSWQPGGGLVSLPGRAASPGGVRAIEIVEQGGVKLVNDPLHPDADENGNVAYPDIDLVQEMTDMLSAVRAYEASVTAINGAKNMALKALDIGRG